MNLRSIPALATIAAAGLSLGCGRDANPPPLSSEEVPAAVEGAFKDANADLQNSAKEVVSAIQGKDEGKALIDLQTLFSRPDLTPDQREAAARSMNSLNEKLRTAASQGDQRAAEALQIYRARK